MINSPGTRAGHRYRHAPYTEIEYWRASVQGAFTQRDYDVSDFDEFSIVGSGVTLSGSSHRTFRLSVNGGLSFVSAASYISLLTDGTSAASDTEGYMHSTAGSGARFLSLHVTRLRLGFVEYKAVRANSPLAVFDNPSPVTHVRLFAPTGASWNGGSYIIGGR